MTTLKELQDRIYRLLSDPDQVGYTQNLILDAIRAAHDAIMPWIPKSSNATITGDAETTVFELPDDLYVIDAILVVSTGEIIPSASLIPGRYIGTVNTSTNDWIEYPHGSISFSKPLSGDYKVYYQAHWLKPDSSWSTDTALDPPEYAITGLMFYAGSYCLVPSAVSLAEIKQFATKVDSGNPESNPMQKASDYLLKLFNNEMGKVPKFQRGQR